MLGRVAGIMTCNGIGMRIFKHSDLSGCFFVFSYQKILKGGREEEEKEVVYRVRKEHKKIL